MTRASDARSFRLVGLFLKIDSLNIIRYLSREREGDRVTLVTYGVALLCFGPYLK